VKINFIKSFLLV